MSLRPRRWPPGLIAIVMLIPLLVGCTLLSGEPRRELYRLAPVLSFPSGLPRVAAQLVIATPTAPGGIDRRRVALIRPPVSLDYFADAEWTDRVPFLVQTALVEGFQQSKAIAAVGSEGLGIHADFVLQVAISHFEAVYDSPDRTPRISVGLDANLIGMPERRIVAETSVSRQHAASANALPAIVGAFDVALAQAVQDVVTWTVTNPALSRRDGSVISRTPFVHPGEGKRP